MDIFDILGPVMVGPSSSHTAGAARIGKMARTLLGGEPMEAKIHLHGSFAETGSGHRSGAGGGSAGHEPRRYADPLRLSGGGEGGSALHRG